MKPFLHSWHTYGLSPVWTLMCRFRFAEYLNAWSHRQHLYAFSPMWVFMWSLRCPERPNALSHTWHLYGFSPLCILLWLTRWLDVLNRLLQTLHSNGFCPEWLRLCTANSLLLLQHLPHSVHLYLPVWMFLWSCRELGDKKLFSHWLQEYKFSPVCLLLWTVKHFIVLKHLPHSVHLNLLVWTLLCSPRALWDEKLFSHWLQEYKRSPVCLLLWVVKHLFVLKHLPHSVHLNLLVWIFLCSARALRDEKLFSHWLQEYVYSPLCRFLCSTKRSFLVNRLLHSAQICSFFLRCSTAWGFRLPLVQMPRLAFSFSSCIYSEVSSLLSASSFTSNVLPVHMISTDEHWQIKRRMRSNELISKKEIFFLSYACHEP